MASLTFDTLRFAKRLKAAGVDSAQAEASAEALAEVLDVNLRDLVRRDDLRELATRAEVNELRAVVEGRFRLLEGQFRLLQWMVGIVVAGVAALLLRAFF